MSESAPKSEGVKKEVMILPPERLHALQAKLREYEKRFEEFLIDKPMIRREPGVPVKAGFLLEDVRKEIKEDEALGNLPPAEYVNILRDAYKAILLEHVLRNQELEVPEPVNIADLKERLGVEENREFFKDDKVFSEARQIIGEYFAGTREIEMRS